MRFFLLHMHCALMPLFAALCTGRAMQLCSPIAPLARVSSLQNLGLQTGGSETETLRRVKFIQVQSVWTAFRWRDRDSGQLLKTQTRSTVSCSFSSKDRYHPQSRHLTLAFLIPSLMLQPIITFRTLAMFNSPLSHLLIR